MPWAFCFAPANAESNRPTRIAMMLITTNNSIKVKAPLVRRVNPSALGTSLRWQRIVRGLFMVLVLRFEPRQRTNASVALRRVGLPMVCLGIPGCLLRDILPDRRQSCPLPGAGVIWRLSPCCPDDCVLVRIGGELAGGQEMGERLTAARFVGFDPMFI